VSCVEVLEIDYEEASFKSGVKLNVPPSVTKTCGCGESIAFW